MKVFRRFSTIVSTVGVVGAGQMGGGIAMVAAEKAKAAVILYDNVHANAARAVDEIRDPSSFSASVNAAGSYLLRRVNRGQLLVGEMDEILSRISTTNDLTSLSRADFVIEVTPPPLLPPPPHPNRPFMKAPNSNAVSSATSPPSPAQSPPPPPPLTPPQEVVIASNTSSIPITRIAALSARPSHVVGMHFMHPVAAMRLVEVVPGLQTSPQALNEAYVLAERKGGGRDWRGFVFWREFFFFFPSHPPPPPD
jgi:3-hydroxybutyryl-CoA dehydrogenase